MLHTNEDKIIVSDVKSCIISKEKCAKMSTERDLEHFSMIF